MRASVAARAAMVAWRSSMRAGRAAWRPRMCARTRPFTYRCVCIVSKAGSQGNYPKLPLQSLARQDDLWRWVAHMRHSSLVTVLYPRRTFVPSHTVLPKGNCSKASRNCFAETPSTGTETWPAHARPGRISKRSPEVFTCLRWNAANWAARSPNGRRDYRSWSALTLRRCRY